VKAAEDVLSVYNSSTPVCKLTAPEFVITVPDDNVVLTVPVKIIVIGSVVPENDICHGVVVPQLDCDIDEEVSVICEGKVSIRHREPV
jgi:hypothetical protein